MKYYNLSTGSNGADIDSDDDEVGLSTFTGKCNNCGQVGHKAFQCPKPKDEKKKFKWKCNGCRKTEHKYHACWGNPKNADKVPDWHKKKRGKEVSAGVVEGTIMDDDVEYLMGSVDDCLH